MKIHYNAKNILVSISSKQTNKTHGNNIQYFKENSIKLFNIKQLSFCKTGTIFKNYDFIKRKNVFEIY